LHCFGFLFVRNDNVLLFVLRCFGNLKLERRPFGGFLLFGNSAHFWFSDFGLKGDDEVDFVFVVVAEHNFGFFTVRRRFALFDGNVRRRFDFVPFVF
jgi:hypothetical protein